MYLCCYNEHCNHDGSCVVGYTSRVVSLGVVGGLRVKFIRCGLESLWAYDLYVFCCVEDMVIV